MYRRFLALGEKIIMHLVTQVTSATVEEEAISGVFNTANIQATSSTYCYAHQPIFDYRARRLYFPAEQFGFRNRGKHAEIS
ncbi:MAG: hypothetical protein RH948_19325 [Cyclobacteriaceae bacterium]